MMNLRKQRGATFVFWVIMLALIGFLFMMGIKLFPVYYRGLAAKKVMEDLAVEMQNKKPNKKQLWDLIDRRLYINNISDVTKEDFVYTVDKRTVEFGIDYEVRVPLIANLDAVAMFDYRHTLNTSNSKN